MSDKLRNAIIIVVLILAYGLVGRMDYDSQVVDSMMDHQTQTASLLRR